MTDEDLVKEQTRLLYWKLGSSVAVVFFIFFFMKFMFKAVSGPKYITVRDLKTGEVYQMSQEEYRKKLADERRKIAMKRERDDLKKYGYVTAKSIEKRQKRRRQSLNDEILKKELRAQLEAQGKL
jgi:hypothetical protein